MAQRAAVDIQVHCAKGGARRQRHDIDRRGRGKVKLAKGSLQHAALRAARNKARGLLRGDAARGGIQHGAQLVRIVGLDDPDDAATETQRADDAIRGFDRVSSATPLPP